MYILSISGRSSRSTLIETKYSFSTSAISGFENDSCSITWHQWHAEYPILKNIGLFSDFALFNASLPQACQSTGFEACANK